MFSVAKKQKARVARSIRVRAKIHGTAERPRLAVYKSAHHVYVQVVDDDKGFTLVSASSLADEIKGKGKERAAAVGKLVAERAVEKGLKSVVFDRSSYQYHGVIKELADAARAAGLQF
jgi:large subunit ribosomal protein L18